MVENYENKVLECKCCNKIINDVENKSGAAISHMVVCYPNIEIPTKFKRASVKTITGKYWHFDYFNIIDKEKPKDIIPIDNEQLAKDIVKDYTENGLGIEALCSKYKFGKLKIKQILSDNNVELKKKGAQQKYGEILIVFDDYSDKSIECKCCGKIFNDVENLSGAAIAHIETCQPNVEIPTKYKRSMVKKTTGKYWHFEYFNVIDKAEEKEQFKCPECDWTTPDLNNISGAFTKHIENEHGDLNEFRIKYPENEYMFKKYVDSEKRIEELEHDSATCKVCGEKMKQVNHTHLQTHGITLSEYNIKYGVSNNLSSGTLNKLKENYDKVLRHHESGFKSKAEVEIVNYIRERGLTVLANDKKTLKGVELDVLVPELKIAFEYNGLYYHTEKMGKDKNYHLNKQNLAKEHGIKLIHIFEDEWLNKKEIVKNRIEHLLGLNNKPKIYARNTVIRKINKDIAISFMEKNHIQGSQLRVTENYGAFYDNILVSVMSFVQFDGYWVLSRFATEMDYRCIGHNNKIFKYFLNQHENITIISFADRRWTTDGNNNMYVNMGFNLVSVNKPDYRYVNQKLYKNQRMHKFLFRKNILIKKYPHLLDENMTETEMINKLGINRIWDCGLFKYEYIKKG